MENGLQFTLDALEHDAGIPVGDYLYIWMVYCNRLKIIP
jgi:hypothetical protein